MQATWASGDYSAIATRIQIISELLIDAADLRPGSRVDVAGGSGNTALAAARSGARVVSLDYVPSSWSAPASAQAEASRWRRSRATRRTFPSPTPFDAAVSAVGVMFAADHGRTAAELLRVCRPGGTIAIANWTPEGFIGRLFRTIGARAAARPA